MKLSFIAAGDRPARMALAPTPHKVPREIIPVKTTRHNQDIRITLAYSLYELCGDEAVVLLHGAPRSGRTTSLIAESKNRNECFLCVEPTNKIAVETVRDACAVSDKGNSNFIINIPANKKGCIKIHEMIEEYPELDQLPIIPLPEKCDKCVYYGECGCTKVARTPSKEIEGISLTYHKLVALMLSDNKMSLETLNKVYKLPKNIIFDECHRMETEEMKYVTLIESSRDGETIKNFDKYDVIQGKGSTPFIIKKFKEIVNSPNIHKSVTKALERAKTQNSFEMSPKYIFKQDDLITDNTRAKLIRNFHHEAVKFVKNLDHIRLTISDIRQLYNILAVVIAHKVQVLAVRDNTTGTIEVRIIAADTILWTQIRAYIQRVQARRKVILTSGTINSSFMYNTMFRHDTPVNKVIWGKNGDPLNTNSKMFVYADHKKYTLNTGKKEYSLMDNIPNIARDIKKILDKTHKLGFDYKKMNDTKIVAMNIAVAKRLRKELKNIGYDVKVDHYRSTESIGVRCDARTMITVGIAYLPSNSFDVVTDNTDDSYIKLNESVHSDTFQMLCRVKDPEGKQPSHIFMIGSNLKECKNVVTWGINRVITTRATENGRICDVVIRSEKISSPNVISCYNVANMIREASTRGFCTHAN